MLDSGAHTLPCSSVSYSSLKFWLPDSVKVQICKTSGLNNGLCYVADWRQESISEEEEEDLQERVWVQGQYSAAFFDSFFFLIVTSVSSGCFYLLIFTAHNSLCGGSRSAACLTPALISISFLSVWLLLLSCIKVHTMTSEVCDLKTVTAFLLMKFLLINCCCINYLLLMWIQTRKSKLYNII